MMYNEHLDLVITRELKASRAKLWRAWTEPSLLQQWWAPKPWKSEVVALDVRPMSAFEIAMLGPDGERFEGPGAFLHVEKERALVWTSALSTGWRPVPDADFPFTAHITMEDHGTGSRYTAHVLHPTPDLRQQHEQMGFFDGWNTCISQLDALALSLED
jgi:uncharacterized protein YndB with AHSA1/START domain